MGNKSDNYGIGTLNLRSLMGDDDKAVEAAANELGKKKSAEGGRAGKIKNSERE